MVCSNTTFLVGMALGIVTISAVSQSRKPLVDEPSRELLGEYAASLGPNAKAFPYSFKFPDDVKDTHAFGIDVSHYQGFIEWDKVVSQGVVFVYMKATQGKAWYDPTFAGNWQATGRIEASRPSFHRGAYHFMTAKDAASLQAKNFIETVGPIPPNALPACLDLEPDLVMLNGKPVRDSKGKLIDQWAQFSPAQIVQSVTTWAALVEKAKHKKPIIYTNSYWWKDRIRSDHSLDGFTVWIADYSSKSLGREDPEVPRPLKWSFWQLTDQGVLTQGGAQSLVDVTIFHGNRSELESQITTQTTKKPQ
jgi:lysozyme